MTPKGERWFKARIRGMKDQMDEAMEFETRRVPLAEELMAKDPTLGFLSAITLAGDKLSMVRSQEWVAEGLPAQDAVNFVGSFFRLEFCVWAHENRHLELGWIIKRLPDLWRGSDPDDTDPRYLELWRTAYWINGRRYIRDGKALPRSRQLTVYRGQDEGAPLGIAWTLDEDIAQKFARGAGVRQTNRPGIVISTVIPRNAALAYLTGRNESEVILPTLGTDYRELERSA